MYRKFDEDYRGCVQASAGTTHCSPGWQLAEWRETWALSMSFHLTSYLQYLHAYSRGFSRAQKFHHIFFIKLRRQYRYIYTGGVDILIQIQCVSKHRVCRYLERMSRQQTVGHQEHGTRTTGTAGAAGQCSKFDTVTVISSTHTTLTTTPHTGCNLGRGNSVTVTRNTMKMKGTIERYTIGRVMGDKARHCDPLRAARDK